jgi:predicted class III extradiol MEMO1 family dioxygenase
VITGPRLRPVQHQIVEVDGEEQHVLTDPSGYVERPIGLSLGAAILAQHFDGTRTLEEIRHHAREAYGLDTSLEAVSQLAAGLDAAGFLESAGFEALRSRANAAYRAAGTRPARFAGESYPAVADALRGELDGRFASVRTAAADTAGATRRRVPPAGIIAPHIDLRVADGTYAAAYAAFVRGAPPPDLFVVFGTSHALLSEPFVASSIPYDTPLGVVPTDPIFLESLASRVEIDLYRDEAMHRIEHSIEFQAVHLRYLFGEAVPPMIAVLTGALDAPLPVTGGEAGAGGSGDDDGSGNDDGSSGDANGSAFYEALRRTAEELGRRVCYVAGADLAHLGPRFDDPDGVSASSLADLERRDRETLGAVARGDAAAFHASVMSDGNARRICGLAPIVATIRCTEGRPATLDAYHQWVEDGSVVSFAAMTIAGS